MHRSSHAAAQNEFNHFFKRKVCVFVEIYQDGLAEWSKALASGASPQGRGFEPHSRHLRICDIEQGELRGTHRAWCRLLGNDCDP